MLQRPAVLVREFRERTRRPREPRQIVRDSTQWLLTEQACRQTVHASSQYHREEEKGHFDVGKLVGKGGSGRGMGFGKLREDDGDGARQLHQCGWLIVILQEYATLVSW